MNKTRLYVQELLVSLDFKHTRTSLEGAEDTYHAYNEAGLDVLCIKVKHRGDFVYLKYTPRFLSQAYSATPNGTRYILDDPAEKSAVDAELFEWLRDLGYAPAIRQHRLRILKALRSE